MFRDCKFYKKNECEILKKIYCKEEGCSFYKKDIEKEKQKKYKEKYKEKQREYNKRYYKEHYIPKRKKITEEERLERKREYARNYYYIYKQKQKTINYKNYGNLEFNDEEIKKIKSGKMRIY